MMDKLPEGLHEKLAKLDPPELIEYIKKIYHNYTKSILSFIYGELISIINNDYSLFSYQEKYEEFLGEIESHLAKEEDAIFPEIIRLWKIIKSGEKIKKPKSSLDYPLDGLIGEHKSHGQNSVDILKSFEELKLRTKSDEMDQILNQFNSFIINLNEHILVEDMILIPRARRIENTFYFD